jgi:hypothetical protein
MEQVKIEKTERLLGRAKKLRERVIILNRPTQASREICSPKLSKTI